MPFQTKGNATPKIAGPTRAIRVAFQRLGLFCLCHRRLFRQANCHGLLLSGQHRQTALARQGIAPGHAGVADGKPLKTVAILATISTIALFARGDMRYGLRHIQDEGLIGPTEEARDVPAPDRLLYR